MNKPSEKAMRLAKDINCKFNQAGFAFEYDEDNGVYQKADFEIMLALEIDTHTTESLAEQHRKTWALAMEAAQQAVRETDLKFLYRINDAIRALLCPPIEATKDK